MLNYLNRLQGEVVCQNCKILIIAVASSVIKEYLLHQNIPLCSGRKQILKTGPSLCTSKKESKIRINKLS